MPTTDCHRHQSASSHIAFQVFFKAVHYSIIEYYYVGQKIICLLIALKVKGVCVYVRERGGVETERERESM